MDFNCYADKNYEVKVRAEGSMNCVYWHANGDWITEFVQKLNLAQQAQVLIGDELEHSSKSSTDDEKKELDSDKEGDSDDVKNMEGVLAEYMNQQMQLEQKMQDQEEEVESLKLEMQKLEAENRKLEEERNLLQKQKEAFVDGREESELNLLKVTEDLAAEKQALSDQFEASRMHHEKQAHQLESALEVESRKLEDREKEHRAEVEDLCSQIEALQKQISSDSKFAEEQRNEREFEREQFQNEINDLQAKVDKKQELFRSDSKLAQEVSRLEEEMDAREQAHKEQIEKMQEEESGLKRTIQEYEENLLELRSKESDQSEIEKAQKEIQDMNREREVLQQELYDNLLKVSALEAKLDQYKHSSDAASANGSDQGQVERLRMNLDQEREAHESKDNEIEHLVGIQSQLRSEVIEKEEEVERLLQEIESYKELEAENIKLKEQMREKSEAEEASTPSSRAEELSALSRQLLDEKNTEIDELQNRLCILESKLENGAGSESFEEEDGKQVTILQKLQEENDQLQAKLQETEEKLEARSALEQMELEVSGQEEDFQVEEEEPTKMQTTEEDSQENLEQLKTENEQLRLEVQKLREAVEALRMETRAHPEFAGLSPETKEKIQDLEEWLEKGDLELDAAKGTEQVDDSPDAAKAEVIKEKLKAIEVELKSQPNSILGRLLLEKDNEISEREQEMEEQKQSVLKLKEEVSGLQHDLSEPDVKIRMKAKTKAPPGKEGEQKDIDIEKAESVSEDDAGSTSSDAPPSDHDDSSISSEGEDGDVSTSSSDRKLGEASKSTEKDSETDAMTTEQPGQEETAKELEELKILLDQKEKNLYEKDEWIQSQSQAIAKKEAECKELLDKLHHVEEKCEELKNELDQRLEEIQQSEQAMPSFAELSEEDILQVPAVQSTLARVTKDLEDALKTTEEEVAISKEEKERLMSDLGDVQREYMALLGESQGIHDLQEDHAMLQDKIKDLESLVAEREAELQQAQQETDEVQGHVRELAQEIELLKQQEEEDDKNSAELEEVVGKKSDEITTLQDEIQQKNEVVEELERQIESSAEKSKAYEEEIELLQNEQQIITSENERLQQDVDELKTKVAHLEKEVNEKQDEVGYKQTEIDVIKKERFIEPQVASLLEEGSLEEESLQSSSSSEAEDVRSPEKMMKMHEDTMKEMKANYTEEMSKAVEETRRQLQEQHEKKMAEIENQHKKEVAELLSESFPGESELERKLREELDHADQLDHNLIGHLAGVPEDSVDTDISTKLQSLLERVHNEGVQVLSLSELQFIKHHHHLPRPPSVANTPPPATVEEAIQTSARLEEDMNQLRTSWENEKLALLNAIQALKELVAHTNPDESTDQLPESCDERGDMLKAIAEVFEREHEALVAELQTSVLEAQQSLTNSPTQDEDVAAADVARLSALQKKIREQGAQHTAALEHLVSMDRDAMLGEIRDLRDDRKKNLHQAEDRIRQLENMLSTNDTSHSQNIHLLQSQVERLEYKLQQERALAADVRTSLESERVRSNDHFPALQRERDRSVELDNEIGRLQKKLAEDAETTRARTEALQTELDDNRQHMEDLQGKLTETRKKLMEAEDAARQEKRKNERAHMEHANTMQDLKRALASEENRRENLAKSLENERDNVAKLHEELATSRANSHQDIEQQKIRYSQLEDAMAVEKHRGEDLESELKKEKESNEGLRQTLDDERELTKEARKQDRATVADLQRILDDAKKETEQVQRKMDSAERDAKVARQQLEDAQAVHGDAVEAERAVIDQLQSALGAVQKQKHDAQRKLQKMEDEMRRQSLTARATNAGVPASGETTEGLMAHRRQLESLRQRLQMESSKLQDLTSKAAQRLPLAPSEVLGRPQDAARVLASEIEQVDSVKRSLAEMQQELKEMYSALSMPQRGQSALLSDPSPFNDRLMEQNAELVALNARHTDEKMTLRDGLRRLEEEVWKARADSENHGSQADAGNKQHQQQVQEMAGRMHRLYTRYLRAESFRKALVYQKKYLLLLIGGFQDCEEATLAIIARMGAYPSRDSYDRSTHRSPAFKKFRSAVRAVIAVSRLKFLVRKWTRTSHSISASIQEKHGTAPILNGHHSHHHSHHRPSPSASPNLLRPTSSTSAHTLGEKSPSPTPLPRYRSDSYDPAIPPYGPYKPVAWAASSHADTPPTKLSRPTSGLGGSYGTSGARPRPNNAYTRSATSPYTPSYGDQPSATALRYLNGAEGATSRPRPRSSYYPDHRTPDLSPLSYSRTQPGESDPSLNEYIQKLENLQHRLEQNPHRYQR